MGRDTFGRQIELYHGRMEAVAREPDVSWHGYHRGRSKWALGLAEGIICQRQRASESHDRSRKQPAGEGTRDGFFYDRSAKRRARWPEGQARQQQTCRGQNQVD